MSTYSVFVEKVENLEQRIKVLENEIAQYQTVQSEIKNAQKLGMQLSEKYANKYGMISEAEQGHYSLAELESIRAELADTSFLTLLKRFFGIGKSNEEIYTDLMRKILGLISYLKIQLEEHGQIMSNARDRLKNEAEEYERAYTGICEAAGFGSGSDWGRYTEPKQVNGELYLGDIDFPLEQKVTYAAKVLQSSMPRSYVESSEGGYSAFIRVPYTKSLKEPVHLLYEFKKAYNTSAVQSMKALFYQILRMTPAYYMEFHLIDGENTGSNFAEIMDLQKVREGELISLNRRVTGGNYHLVQTYLENKQISDILKNLEQYMSRVAEEMGQYETLWEYNQANSDKMTGHGTIPYQIIIIENFPVGFNDEDIKILDKLVKNGPKRGISTIILNNLDKWTELQRSYSSEKAVTLYTKLSAEALRTLDIITIERQDSRISAEDCQSPCSLQFLRNGYPDYIQSVIAVKNAIQEVDNYFPHVIDTEMSYGSKTSEKGLRIPFAIDRKGNIMEYCLGEALNAHGLICGGTGSGKTTLLHMLISSVVMNYSPEDVEIWLTDYKITEFHSYKNNTPPHIRFIGLSKTSDFSYALIDKITNEMNRRQTVIAEADELLKSKGERVNITSFNDYRKVFGLTSMTRLLVIIDEFHVMAQHAQAESDYKQKLENLLAEARALGIILLFSDQAIVDGLRGLSEKGKKQIKARIALSNYEDELKETLNEKDREKIKPFLTMKCGEVAVQTVAEERDEDGILREKTQIERGKCIFIDGQWRYTVNEKARKLYQAEDYISDCFDDKVVEAINWKDVQEWENKFLKPHRHGGKDMQIYLGKPINLNFSMHFPLLQRKGNNLMSIGGSEEQQMQILQAVVGSFSRQEDYEIVLMTDPYASLYREFHVEIKEMSGNIPQMTVYEELEDICYQINKLLATMNHRDNQKKILVIWLGLDIIADLLAEEKSKKPEILEQLIQNADQKVTKEKIVKKEKQPSAQDELEKMFGDLFGDFDSLQEEEDPYAEEEEELEENYLYNACDDISKIIHIGPSRNIYNFVIYDTSAALKDFRGAKVGDFVHKIAFSMSDDEASDYLGSSRYIRELPENLAFYYNGRNGKKFIPYKL